MDLPQHREGLVVFVCLEGDVQMLFGLIDTWEHKDEAGENAGDLLLVSVQSVLSPF